MTDDVLYRGNRDSRSARRTRRLLPTGEIVESRGVIATAIALSALAASAAAGGTVAAGAMSSHAANKGARLATDAANHGADLQAQSTREALDFQKSEAARSAANEEVTRRANYDQYVAQQRRRSTLGQMLGYAPIEIPPYVPLNTGQQPGQPGQPGPQGSPAPAGDLSAARAKFDQLFPDATLTPDMVKAKEAELKAAGFTLRPNAAGQVGKIQYGSGPIIDIIQGAGSGLNRKQWLLPSAAGPSLGQMAAGPMGYQRSTPTTAIAPGVMLPQSQPTYARPPQTLYDYAAGAY